MLTETREPRITQTGDVASGFSRTCGTQAVV
jgi:hypothetical protein